MENQQNYPQQENMPIGQETQVAQPPQEAQAPQEVQVPQELQPAQTTENKPSKREAFLALYRNRPTITDFTGYAVVDIRYSTEEALGLLVKRLKERYFHLDERFLGLAEGRLFAITYLYVPVYRANGVANYYWKKGSKKDAEEFASTVKVAATVSAFPDFLEAENFGRQGISPTETAFSEDKLITTKKPTLKEGMRLLKEEADEAKPTQKADCILTQENYQLIYVPVMKAELTYGDKVYTQWVNLVNGECQVEYAVAHEIVAAADKTMEKLARRKRSIFSCLLYALTFVILNVLQWQLGEPQKVDGGMEAWLLTVILGAIAAVELVLWAACFGYKQNKMIDRAVLENKMPSAKASVLWNLLAILLAIGSVVLFAVFALI